jgi:L-amino acid N-acyltransferase YncA
MLRRWQAVLDRGLPYLVAEFEDYIVGFCYASQFRPREGYGFTVEVSIYERPHCIGHVVGKMLLAALILVCQAKDCHSMIACICRENVSSVALHASLGFQQVGLLPEAGNKFGEWLRLLIMQRPCDETRQVPPGWLQWTFPSRLAWRKQAGTLRILLETSQPPPVPVRVVGSWIAASGLLMLGGQRG